MPALWLGGLAGGIAPRARQADDTGVDPEAIDAAVAAAVAIVVALDAALAAGEPAVAPD